jgi:YVTN family beta-propeller protein
MMKRLTVPVLGALASGLFAMAAMAGTTVYVPMGSGNEILMIDAETDEITGKITDISEVHGLAGTKDGKYLIAGSFAETDADGSSAPPKPKGVSEDEHRAHHAKTPANTPKSESQSIVSVIRIADAKVVRRIIVPGAVHHLALTPDGQFAIATHPGQDSVSIIDLAKFTVIKTLKTGSTPNYAVVSQDGKRSYVSNAGDNTVSEIDPGNWMVLRTFKTGETPEHLTLTANGAMLYVANVDDGAVSAISLKDATPTRTYKVGGLLHGVDLSDDGRIVFVSAKEENKLVAIDLASGQVRNLSLEPSPYHLAAIAGTGKLYISSADDPKLWVVDQKTLRVQRNIDIRGKGHQMVVLTQ